MKSYNQKFVYNGTEVHCFCRSGYSYKDTFPILERYLGKIKSLHKIGPRNHIGTWQHDDAARVTFNSKNGLEILWISEQGKTSPGICLGPRLTYGM